MTKSFDVNEYINKHRKIHIKLPSVEVFKPLPHIECADGFRMSVQAGEYMYCTPRNNYGPYAHVEVGFPSERVEELMFYADDPECPTETVYGYVPVELVEAIINKHNS